MADIKSQKNHQITGKECKVTKKEGAWDSPSETPSLFLTSFKTYLHYFKAERSFFILRNKIPQI